MPFWELLLDAVVLLSAALLLGAAMELVRQSAIVGFILAGTLVGPGGLALVSGESGVNAIAELGVALLLFSIGLEFSAARLRAMGVSVLALGAGQVVVTLLVAAAAGRLAGLAIGTAVVVGAMVSLSSTAVVLRVLSERAEMDSVHGRAGLGVLLVQDAAVVPLVLLVSALLPSAAAAPHADAVSLLPRLAGGAAALAGLIAFNRLVLPRLLAVATLSRNRELHILFAVAVAIGGAWLSHTLGLSPSLGAFVAGAVLGDSAVSLQVRADVAPLRTLFTTLFFGSIGMLGDPAWIAGHLGEVSLAVAALIVGKAIVVWPLARLSGLSHGHAVATGLCVAQSGEFSFVLAQTAQSGAAPLLSADGFALVVSATIGGLLLTPYLVAAAPLAGAAVERLLGREAGRRGAPAGEPASGHVIVIGYGPAGRAVAATVADAGGRVVVVDLSPRSVVEARRSGHTAHLGDAAAVEILEESHVSTARAVVVAIPDHRTALQVIARSRSLAPSADLVVRARYAIHAGALTAAGATVVIDEEVEVGHRLGEAVRSLMTP